MTHSSCGQNLNPSITKHFNCPLIHLAGTVVLRMLLVLNGFASLDCIYLTKCCTCTSIILHTICLFFSMLMFVLEVRSGAEKLHPVVIAPCVCVMLVVCVPDEEAGLAVPLPAALREAHAAQL